MWSDSLHGLAKQAGAFKSQKLIGLTAYYAGLARRDIEETFEQNLALVYARRETPRLSGVQIKAPKSQTADGTLVPAIGQPNAHMLKPVATRG